MLKLCGVAKWLGRKREREKETKNDVGDANRKSQQQQMVDSFFFDTCQGRGTDRTTVDRQNKMRLEDAM